MTRPRLDRSVQEKDDERFAYSSSSDEDGCVKTVQALHVLVEPEIGENVEGSGDICYTVEEVQVIRDVLSQLDHGSMTASKLESFTLEDWREEVCGPIIRRLKSSECYRASALDGSYRFGRDESVPPLRRFICNHLVSGSRPLPSKAIRACDRRRAFAHTANAMRGTTKDSFLDVFHSGSIGTREDSPITRDDGVNCEPTVVSACKSAPCFSVIAARLLEKGRLYYNNDQLGVVTHTDAGDTGSSTQRTTIHQRAPQATRRIDGDICSRSSGNANAVEEKRVEDGSNYNRNDDMANGGGKLQLPDSSEGNNGQRETGDTVTSERGMRCWIYAGGTACNIDWPVGCDIACLSSNTDSDSDTGEPPVVLPLSRPRKPVTSGSTRRAGRRTSAVAPHKETDPDRRRSGNEGVRSNGKYGFGNRDSANAPCPARPGVAEPKAAAQVTDSLRPSARSAVLLFSMQRPRPEEGMDKSVTRATNPHQDRLAVSERRSFPVRFVTPTNGHQCPLSGVGPSLARVDLVEQQNVPPTSLSPSTGKDPPGLEGKASPMPATRESTAASLWADVKPEDTPEGSSSEALTIGNLGCAKQSPSCTRAGARHLGERISNKGEFFPDESGESHDAGRERRDAGHTPGRWGRADGDDNAVSSDDIGRDLYERATRSGAVARPQMTPFQVTGDHRRLTCSLLW